MANCLKEIEQDLRKEATIGAVLSAGAGMIGRGAVNTAGAATRLVGQGMRGAGKMIKNHSTKGTALNNFGKSLRSGGKSTQAYGSGALQTSASKIGANISGGVNTLKQAYKAPAAI